MEDKLSYLKFFHKKLHHPYISLPTNVDELNIEELERINTETIKIIKAYELEQKMMVTDFHRLMFLETTFVYNLGREEYSGFVATITDMKPTSIQLRMIVLEQAVKIITIQAQEH